MGAKTAIEWTDRTCTPIRARNRKTGKVGWHCEHATTGCKFCYAEGINKRLGTGLPFKPAHLHTHGIELFLDENMLTQPLRWKKPSMIFMCSMTDMFADFVPDEWIDRIFAVMALTPQHTYQVLTKRSKRMRKYLSDDETAGRIASAAHEIWARSLAPEAMGSLWVDSKTDDLGFKDFDLDLVPWPLRNVWLGVSAERQEEADERIPDLLATPAAVRFLSAEPLLGPINLDRIHEAYDTPEGARIDMWESCLNGKRYDMWAGDDEDPMQPGHPKLDWVIVGGESGQEARPMQPAWARSLRDQCAAAGVAFLFKQWGSTIPGELMLPIAGAEDTPWRRYPDGSQRWAAEEYGVAREQLPKVTFMRTGKKKAGRLLDGVEHNGFPVTAREAA